MPQNGDTMKEHNDMENLKNKLNDILNEDCIMLTLSNPKLKEGASKVKARPVSIRGRLCFQFTEYRGTQVFHANCTKEEAVLRVAGYMESFKQAQIVCKEETVTVLSGSKGNISVICRRVKTEAKQEPVHNRKKSYILEEGRAVAFLEDLGVMTKDGAIVRQKYDKYRQINRFLEFVEDILEELPKDRELTIIDFGCGKSYLTFAMYYYLKLLKGYRVKMIGLDLKEDVIDECNRLSEKYGYSDGLSFLTGDIADYEGVDRVDMVVTLHACDTATDYALSKAVKWGASVILSVPCCQHELNAQLSNRLLEPVMQYGIIKERMAALLTDGLRAQYLESRGYRTQILEFIDMEHTPKNLLIRAVRKKSVKAGEAEQITGRIGQIEEFFAVEPKIKILL